MSNAQTKQQSIIDERNAVAIESSSITEVEGMIVMTGILSRTNFQSIRVDGYQREAGFSPKKIRQIEEAMKKGERFQAITLGVRSGDYLTKKGSTTVFLPPETYLIDGLQRYTGFSNLLNAEITPKSVLPITVYFETNHAMEVEMFQNFNQKVTRVSAQKLLANDRFMHKNIDSLVTHTDSDPNFVWRGKVCWSQNTKVGDVISGRKYFQNALLIHGRFFPVPSKPSNEDLIRHFDKIVDRVTSNMLILNMRNFCNFFDKVWVISQQSQNSSRKPVKGVFMELIASIIARNKNFWQNTKLVIPELYFSKFSQIHPGDLNIEEIPNTSHPSFDIAVRGLEDFLNKKLGSKNKLQPF